MTSYIFLLFFNLQYSGIFFSLASFARNLVLYCIIYYKLSVGLAIEISFITFVFYWISGTCLLGDSIYFMYRPLPSNLRQYLLC